MPAGLQVWGSHGLTQIDGDYKNLALRQSASIATNGTMEGDFGTLGSRTGWISYAGIQNPVIAVRCAQAASVLAWDGANSRFRLCTNGGLGTAINYYIFGEPPGSSNYGVQVFNGSGELVFDALHSPMRVVHFAVVAGNGSTTLPSGRDYATIISGGASVIWSFEGSSFVSTYRKLGASVSGGYVEWLGIRTAMYITSGASSPITANNATVLIVDVTGY